MNAWGVGGLPRAQGPRTNVRVYVLAVQAYNEKFGGD